VQHHIDKAVEADYNIVEPISSTMRRNEKQPGVNGAYFLSHVEPIGNLSKGCGAHEFNM